MPAKPKKTAAKPKREKRPPKAAPRSAVKQPEEIEGQRPLSQFDYDFCRIYVQTNKQVEAYRQLDPEAKDPHRAAYRMMERPEIREHIKAIFKYISQHRNRAAEASAKATMLSVELADERLVDLLGTRRRTRGEMLTKDVKMLLIPGAMPSIDENGKEDGMTATPKLLEDLAGEQAPIEDADLLKAIKTAYERKGAIRKAEEKTVVSATTVLLYKPTWLGKKQEPLTIEGETA